MGRVIRDIKRKSPEDIPEKLKRVLELGQKVFEQERGSKGKVYSLHERSSGVFVKGESASNRMSLETK